MQVMTLFSRRLFITFLIAAIFACSVFTVNAADNSATTEVARASLPRGETIDYGTAPAVNNKPLSKKVRAALTTAFGDLDTVGWDQEHSKALKVIKESGDARLVWIITDMMRFVGDPDIRRDLTDTANTLLGTNLRGIDAWHELTERLIDWDIPAPPDYLEFKRKIFIAVLPAWEPLFKKGDIDWRHVSWGGVRIDDRPFDKTDEHCNCIPAADNPETTKAADAKWLADDDIVFGVAVNGEYRAYPRQIMEVREMVNDTLGGRDLGIPYCTLCGSAQAWFTDEVPAGVDRPVLRTSGLLIRSNKVMFDLNTYSVFDTFRGQAVTGPLAQRNIQLKQAAVITTTWGAWKAAHPSTTVLVEELALGQDFDFRNGRDANGPIFPIGNADPRLAVQEDVMGIVTEAGVPLAFHVPSLIKALDAGEKVTLEGVEVVLDARGVRAINTKGEALGTHQAFWFAWSQFYPGTRLWPEFKRVRALFD